MVSKGGGEGSQKLEKKTQYIGVGGGEATLKGRKGKGSRSSAWVGSNIYPDMVVER